MIIAPIIKIFNKHVDLTKIIAVSEVLLRKEHRGSTYYTADFSIDVQLRDEPLQFRIPGEEGIDYVEGEGFNEVPLVWLSSDVVKRRDQLTREEVEDPYTQFVLQRRVQEKVDEFVEQWKRSKFQEVDE